MDDGIEAGIPSTPSDNQTIPDDIAASLNSNTQSSPGGVEASTANEAKVVKTRPLKSLVWKHFERVDIGGVFKAICIYCKKKLNGGSNDGTTHLKNHWKICPRRTTSAISQMSLNPTKTLEGKSTIALHAFDPEVSRNDLANMIIMHEYPLSIVEHVGFRKFCSGLQPLFKMVARNTVKKDILKIYQFQKCKMMSLLEKNEGRIAITSDLWTASNQNKHYMVITAHFVDNAWVLRNCILR